MTATGAIAEHLAQHFGLSRVPAWLLDGFVPEMTLVESPVVDELRGEHLALLAGVEAARRAYHETYEREAPAGFNERMVWQVDGGQFGQAANRPVAAARDAVNASIVALCEWMLALRKDPGRVQREADGLVRRVPRNDEQRWPEVGAVIRLAFLLTDRDMAKSVNRVFRGAGGEDLQYSLGVTW